MGIDGIGKGGPKLPLGGPAETTKAGQPFEVTRPEKAGPAAGVSKVQGAAVSPLEKLQAGQIDLNGYLDLKVENATASLKGLSPVELDGIKKALRDQLATDPTLADLVKSATGASPAPPED
jgi:hypothetical protein